MDLPKPSFLRTPVRSDWQPMVKAAKKDQPGRLISLKALRKEYLSPIYSSFLSTLSSSHLPNFPKLTHSVHLSRTEPSLLVSVVCKKTGRLQTSSKRGPKQEGRTVGEVVGKQLLSPQSRITIQIQSKLPQRYSLMKSISRSQRNSPRSKAE